MQSRAPAQEEIFKVLLKNKDGNNCVNDPISLCIENLPQVKRKYIPEFLRRLEKKHAITIFRKGVVTNNGGVIYKVKILRKEFSPDKRTIIKW
ncbi:MAG: hypothetical protein ABIG29_01140 [Candidatus Nealsonbacteria bacterium]